MLKPLSFQLSCGGNEYIMCKNIFEDESVIRQSDFIKAGMLWDVMHKLDYIAEDAVVRKESPAMVLRFMNEVLQNDEEREYFLHAYYQAIYNEGWKAGHAYPDVQEEEDYGWEPEYPYEDDFQDDYCPYPPDACEPDESDLLQALADEAALADKEQLASLQDSIDSSTELLNYLERHRWFVTLVAISNTIVEVAEDMLDAPYSSVYRQHQSLSGGGIVVGAGPNPPSMLLYTITFKQTVFEIYGYGDGLLIRFYPESKKDDAAFLNDEIFGVWLEDKHFDSGVADSIQKLIECLE